ncbi:hypothetical protein C1H46_017176 [Malus baccata]|uniref:Uncharacterized protein n=1 Tax=Malus baccata TaxID=106549 RepID=A0A540MEB7_MALBA|nr:hypothetical protein C1H46_017176 [Malus baccata]
MCRLLVFTPTQVFPVPPLSLCYVPVSAASFMGFHKLHTGSWLFPLDCRLSPAYYGYAHVAFGVGGGRHFSATVDWDSLGWIGKLMVEMTISFSVQFFRPYCFHGLFFCLW